MTVDGIGVSRAGLAGCGNRVKKWESTCLSGLHTYVSNERMTTMPKAVKGKSEGTSAPTDTRQTILDTAERLFAEHGIDATSVRDITQAAEVNLAAINYHFGSKDQLLVEVFTRRLKPLNEARLAWLTKVEEEALPGKPTLEQVLEAFIHPTLDQRIKEPDTIDSFGRLLCRCFQDPNPEMEAIITEQFGELVRRFHRAMLDSVPGLPSGEVFWQMSFMFGSLHHALDSMIRFDRNPFTRLSGATVATKLDHKELAKRHIIFAAAGIRAAVPKQA
jgi:AcrR family transcriptional regulator